MVSLPVNYKSSLFFTVSCGSLENPDNGTVVINAGEDATIATGVGATATYTCNLGYRRTEGSMVRTCLMTGTWNGEMAICECKHSLEMFVTK